MTTTENTTLTRLLASFGVAPDALLGHGGEACVFALDAERILRVHHVGTDRRSVASRASLLAELGNSTGKVPFAIPSVIDTAEIEDRIVTIEPRLPGRPLSEILKDRTGETHAALVRAYLEAAAQIGELAVTRPWYGDLCRPQAIRTSTFSQYLKERAARSLTAAGPKFGVFAAEQLAEALPEPATPALVHLDVFPGNMLAEGDTITAVIDFGTVSIVGDRRLDPLTAAAYLDSAITPTATAADRSVAHEWLAVHGLDELYRPARRWIAAFWSFATDDQRLSQWCHNNLQH